MLNNGDGSLRKGPTTTLTAFNPQGSSIATVATVADVNGDGNLDVIVTSPSSLRSHDIEIRLGNGDGTFRQAKYATAGPISPYGIAVGDFNHEIPQVDNTSAGSLQF